MPKVKESAFGAANFDFSSVTYNPGPELAYRFKRANFSVSTGNTAY